MMCKYMSIRQFPARSRLLEPAATSLTSVDFLKLEEVDANRLGPLDFASDVHPGRSFTGHVRLGRGRLLVICAGAPGRRAAQFAWSGILAGRVTLCVVVSALLVFSIARNAGAQGAGARVEVRLDTPAGDPGGREAGVDIELRSTTDPSLSWSASVSADHPALFRFVPPGRYRLISAAFERDIDARAGAEITVNMNQPAPTANAAPPLDVQTRASGRTGYGTRF